MEKHVKRTSHGCSSLSAGNQGEYGHDVRSFLISSIPIACLIWTRFVATNRASIRISMVPSARSRPLGRASRRRVADHLNRIREYEQRAFEMERQNDGDGPSFLQDPDWLTRTGRSGGVKGSTLRSMN